jgi:hypothetical protein
MYIVIWIFRFGFLGANDSRLVRLFQKRFLSFFVIDVHTYLQSEDIFAKRLVVLEII